MLMGLHVHLSSSGFACLCMICSQSETHVHMIRCVLYNRHRSFTHLLLEREWNIICDTYSICWSVKTIILKYYPIFLRTEYFVVYIMRWLRWQHTNTLFKQTRTKQTFRQQCSWCCNTCSLQLFALNHRQSPSVLCNINSYNAHTLNCSATSLHT